MLHEKNDAMILEYCGINTPTYLVNPSFPVKVQLSTFNDFCLAQDGKRFAFAALGVFAFFNCRFGVVIDISKKFNWLSAVACSFV